MYLQINLKSSKISLMKKNKTILLNFTIIGLKIDIKKFNYWVRIPTIRYYNQYGKHVFIKNVNHIYYVI